MEFGVGTVVDGRIPKDSGKYLSNISSLRIIIEWIAILLLPEGVKIPWKLAERWCPSLLLFHCDSQNITNDVGMNRS